jgi:hypothetical protein
VPEIVIVIADLYLKHDAPLAAAAPRGALPGIESAARFGERTSLAHGWRAWLAAGLGRADLATVAPARIAGAAAAAAGDSGTTWIATPLELTVHSSGAHLEHRGILRLPRAELTTLARAFADTFGPSGFALTPLPSGDFLLETPGIAAVSTLEPARWAGGDVALALPRGPAAASLRRFLSEIEMWLHAHELNEDRRRRRERAVMTLWPWGAAGEALPPERRGAQSAGPQGTPLAFGSEPYLGGLWRLLAGECRALPQRFEEIASAAREAGAVLVVSVGAELERDVECTLADAMSRLDARFVSPALDALRRGEVGGVTLIANDTRLRVRRHSHLRLWRRVRAAGLESFA